MNSISNYVQLIGNLGREVEFKMLDNGNTLAKLSIATREVRRTQTGEKHVEVQWHTVIGWGRVADMMQVLLKKGSSVLVQGKLQHRLIGEGEQKQLRTEVVAKEFRLIKS